MPHTYKNVSPLAQDLIGYGHFEPGQEFETENELNNPNFQEVQAPEAKPTKK